MEKRITRIKKIKPMFNRIITTCHRYETDVYDGAVIVGSKGDVKLDQKVIAVGSIVKNIKEGDVVLVDPARYVVMKHKDGSLKDGIITDNTKVGYNWNKVNINDEECLLLYDSDITYVIEDYDYIEINPEEITETRVIPPTVRLIVPKHQVIL